MAIYVPEFAADLTDPSRCVSIHWSLPVQCVMPRAHRENWHEGWHPDTANRLRYRRAFGSYLTEQLVVGVWQSLNIPAPNAAAATPPTDQQFVDAVAAAITADAMKPKAQRVGLVHAALAVVQPELDRLAAESSRARAELATTREQVAAVLALPSIGAEALELMDPEQYHQAIGYNDGLAASTHAVNDVDPAAASPSA